MESFSDGITVKVLHTLPWSLIITRTLHSNDEILQVNLTSSNTIQSEVTNKNLSSSQFL